MGDSAVLKSPCTNEKARPAKPLEQESNNSYFFMYKETIKKILTECGFPSNLVKPESEAEKAGVGESILNEINNQAIILSQKVPEFYNKGEQAAAASIFTALISIKVNKGYSFTISRFVEDEQVKKLLSYLDAQQEKKAKEVAEKLLEMGCKKPMDRVERGHEPSLNEMLGRYGE